MMSLMFFEPNVAACWEQLETVKKRGKRRVCLHSWTALSAKLVQDHKTDTTFTMLARPDGVEQWSGLETAQGLGRHDVLLLTEIDGQALSDILMEYIHCDDITILAPITSHYFKNRALFLISIPKGGTHLLYRLVEGMGYARGIVHDGNPKPGSWYCVEYSNSHTVAKDFFIDGVRRAPFGNRHHPFPRTPTLFIYRNPLDIVVSEANYHHRDGATLFSSYLGGMDFEQRLLRLIDDPLVLGSIRDRINNFVPWLECQNVVPVSFEELIGVRGGGNDSVRDALIWSLQLKLHVPGDPSEIGSLIFDEASPTFHEGKIGAARERMSEWSVRKFFTLNQDFMLATGYLNAHEIQDAQNVGWDMVNMTPSRADEFRGRPLRTSSEDFRDVPVAVEWNFLGHNIVRFDGRYFGVRQSAGVVDLVEWRCSGRLNTLTSANDIETLKGVLVRGTHRVGRWRGRW